MRKYWQKAEEILKKGGVAIIPTDTIYGIVGSTFSKKTVERIYKLKGRNKNKPFIVLISSYENLKKFGIRMKEKQAKILGKFWPGKVSIILSCSFKKFEYLHRGAQSIAFRMISSKNKNLFNLIKKVGPIVAPSANPQNLPPAKNIKEAKQYFKDKVDYYLSSGTKNKEPSTLVEYKNDKITVLRQGAFKI
jgi:L-threonylcarbamoyladenylate synthase